MSELLSELRGPAPALSRWQLHNGWIEHLHEDRYWGEIPRPRMQAVIDCAKTEGWRRAIDLHLRPDFPHLVDMVTSSARCDWLQLLDLDRARILDVGSGWGQTSLLMAKAQHHRVVSVEGVRERAEFQAIRAQQERIGGLDIVNARFEALRFRAQSFDLVTLIGVLEWMGLAGAPTSPRTVQLQALRQIHQWLRPQAKLCVGIENRWGFNNLLGARDHSGLRFTSLLPRRLAHRYMALRRPSYRSETVSTGYRTYTYSIRGYRQLFAEAGFDRVEFWVAHPHYAQPRCLIPADDAALNRFFRDVYRPRGAKDALFSAIFRGLGHSGGAAKLAPHFIIIATA